MKSISINLSSCSNEHPVSVGDILTIATALRMPRTDCVIVKCYGVEIPIQVEAAGYVVGNRRFDNAYEAATLAIINYYEFIWPVETIYLEHAD